MPDQNVTVGFTPPDNSSWSFVDMKVVLTSAGKIIFHRDPKSPNWTFVSVNRLPADWTGEPQGNGSLYVVNDNLIPRQGSFPYTVTILSNGQDFTSPLQWTALDGPPIIMNDG